MDELLEQFLVEGRDLVAQAAADFARLGEMPGEAAAIDSAFRAIHTLKGSVGIFPMGPAERVLHAAEDVLERARKRGASLDGVTIDGLVACLDAVDRWIDQIERHGSVSADAEGDAQAALAKLSGMGEAAKSGALEWVAGPHQQIGATVAFRYTPDPECFFRGDDPLAVVAEVPELLELRILPVGGAWPALDTVEPFRCYSVLEGVSAASLEDVQAAFRMMPDEVVLQRVAAAVSEAEPVGDARAATSLRVDVARIDALADGLGELIVATNGFAPLSEHAERLDRGLAGHIRAVQAEIERITAVLHRSVRAARLVPLTATFRRLPRLAREISEGLGKPIRFSMAGDRLEVDKQIADGLFEPLLHLLRNAIDHGIEPSERRAAAGKPAEGHITLTATRDGDAVLVELADDGAGIDPARLRQVAVSRGIVTSEAAEQMSDAAALRLIFAPGFSTAATVTEVSGRGVGMDAVQAAIERLRGTIDVEGSPGTGTRFRLRLPANALTTRLLVVEAAGERYGVPLDQIVETVRLADRELIPVGAGVACVLRGRTVPVLDLAALLGGTSAPTRNAKLLVTRSGGERVALRVDAFAQRVDTIVRPPSGLLAAVPGVIGSSLMGDGGVLLVLDLPGLAA